METKNALDALAALAHRHRLEVFRMLIRATPNGLPAGSIAGELELPPSSLSFHLAQLERAGLIRSRRRGPNVIYGADTEGSRRLIAFLTQDCCAGRPELCAEITKINGACR